MHTVQKNSMLTTRQQQFLDFICEPQQRTSLTPSSLEIQEHFGLVIQEAMVALLRVVK